MTTPIASVVLLTFATVVRPLVADQRPSSGPPVPFVDEGACPFEGCVYREWTANQDVVVYAKRALPATVAFRVQRGEKVTALTGVVVTMAAGRVQFRHPIDLAARPALIHIEPGQTLYTLTYEGEGVGKAWFKGQLYTDVDLSSVFNGVCDVKPDRCMGRVVQRDKTEWWVQIRNRAGRIGWSREPDKFDGKDAYGK